MPIHIVGGDGRWRAPFVYPVRLADRLERRYEEDRANPVTLAWFSRGVVVQAGDAGIRFLLVSGRPIEEPVAWYGPIVMNTEAQLQEAFAELRRGTFIKERG